MKRLTILVDMDNALECLVVAWTAELNRRYGTSISEDDVTDWNIAKFFPTLTKEQLFSPLNDVSFWDTLSPMQNAQEILKRIIDDGHTVRVVTASHYSTVAPKITWLLNAYPYLRWGDIIIASDKKLISGDVLIDDGVHNLESAQCVKMLFDRPHNRSYDAEANRMIRVKTWDEIYKHISNIAGG